MISNYYKARKYAWKLVGTESLDLLHDSYLTWYKKANNNLFDQHERTVMSVVKFEFKQKLRKQLMMIDGELIKRTYVDQELPSSEIYIPYDYETLTANLPFKTTVDMLSKGYTRKDIAHSLGISKQAVNKQVNKIKKCLK